MTDTDEQINAAIFKANGWVKSTRPGDYRWVRGSEHRMEVPNYTHDWRLCGGLLKEMSEMFRCNYCGMVLPSPDTFHDLQSCAEYLKSDNARLTAELAELRERTRWIPVSERLPEVGEPVLLYLPSAWNMNGHLGIDGNWYDSDNDQFRSVTHWMPLPEPPEAD